MSKDKGEPTIQEIVGARIRALRKAKGWTQEELGGRAELDFTTIGGAERGEKSLSPNSLVRVAAALEVELAWLVRPEETESGAVGEGLIEELLGLLRDLPEPDLQHVVDLARLEKDYLARVRG
jgi:transcriptional regulator with XRE-family HTH domain